MSDLIYRQQAIDALDKHIDTFDAIDTNYLCGLRTAMSILKEMPSAQPHWIPCSERLPDYGEVVLWCNKHGSVFASAITYQSVDYFSVGKHGGNRTIIAWMPPPEPYGGESDG